MMTTTAAATPVERPILFSGAMVRAMLEGRKTQTRRVVKGEPAAVRWNSVMVNGYGGWTDEHGRPLPCPYGRPGDRLWVRETMRIEYSPCRGAYAVAYRAGGSTGWGFDVDAEFCRAATWRPIPGTGEKATSWKPSIHMPRWASRLTMEIAEVRVERLQAISEEDCWREGIERSTESPTQASTIYSDYASPRRAFNLLWDEINEKRGFGWDVNPWVWAITFRRIEA